MLKRHFAPPSHNSLAITFGVSGARLTHSHSKQYTYVSQTLELWHEVMKRFYHFWHVAEQDFLDPSNGYRLCDTGQGLQRVQGSAQRVGKMMRNVIARVQKRHGMWVGSQVVHLGDRDVPNSFIFINKYTQLGQILAPLCSAIRFIHSDIALDQGLVRLCERKFGGLEQLELRILRDFFSHGFDGSGADNDFDAGSCIDGRSSLFYE